MVRVEPARVTGTRWGGRPSWGCRRDPAVAPRAIRAAKEAGSRACECPLEAGLEFERRNFFLLFATEDQKEGMRAFLEKRPPEWKGR